MCDPQHKSAEALKRGIV